MKNNTNVASAAITTDPAVNAAKTVSPRRTTNAVIDASRARCARRFAATFGGRSTGRSLATSYGSITPRGGERPRPVDRRDQTGGAEQEREDEDRRDPRQKADRDDDQHDREHDAGRHLLVGCRPVAERTWELDLDPRPRTRQLLPDPRRIRSSGGLVRARR